MLPKNFPYRKELKRKAAEKRQEDYNDLAPATILANLDRAFGPGLGAKRQRTRLAKKMAAPQPAPEPTRVVESEEKPAKKPSKKREGKKKQNSDS